MDRNNEEVESYQYEIDGVTYTLIRDKGMEEKVRELLNTMTPAKFKPQPPSEDRIAYLFEKVHTTEPKVIVCPRCGSEDVWKHGTQSGNQMYLCARCKRRFNVKGAPMKMQTSADQIGLALGAYYAGMSLSRISNQLNVSFGTKVDPSTVYRWLLKYTQKGIDTLGSLSPQVSDIWVADETVIDVRGFQTKSTSPHTIWFWDMIDEGTRFLLASYMSPTRRTVDVVKFMQAAQTRADKAPKIILTDKLRAYIDGIERTFGADTHHIQSQGFTSEINTNLIERFHGTVKQRTNSIRGFKTLETADLILQGFLVDYNFFRPHMTLAKKTPADVAGIKYEIRNWTDLVKAGL